jgi:uncharacterized DUF497 family protein
MGEIIYFDWDKYNIAHIAKHNVQPKEAEETFYDSEAKRYDDQKHSSPVEKRYLLFGQTKQKRKLVIVFTIRESKIRVVSARPMNRKEVPIYEKKFKHA